MVTYAVTLSDLIEKGGAYAGLAAFFGLAVLSILYFAQAREIRRLRDWAGRAPERAQELEQRVVEQADSARRVQAAPQRRPGAPATAAAQAVSKPPPEAADAPTTAEPAVEPETPAEEESSAQEHEVVAPAAAAEAEAEPTTEAPVEDKPAEEEGVPAGATARAAEAGGATQVVPAVGAPSNGTPAETPSALPKRATQGPPARRPAPAQPLRATTPPSRRPGGPAGRPVAVEPEEPSGRRAAIIVAAVAAGVILIVVGLIAIFSGGDDSQPASTQGTDAGTGAQTEPTTVPEQPSNGGGKRPSGNPTRSDTNVAVLNGTTITGLAGTVNTRLEQAGYTAIQNPADYTDQARSATVVFYNGSANRTQAAAIGKLLEVSDVRPIEEDPAKGLAPGADVIVVTGADQSP